MTVGRQRAVIGWERAMIGKGSILRNFPFGFIIVMITQKNIRSKFNFYKDLHKKNILFQSKNHANDYKALNTSRTSRRSPTPIGLGSDHGTQKEEYPFLKDHVNTSYLHQPSFSFHQPASKRLGRRTSICNIAEIKTNNLDRNKPKTFSILAPSSSEMPKLRETGSTQCQTPKADVAKRPHSKISQFRKLKVLGKGRFGHVYLVKHIQTGFMAALKVIRKIDLLCDTPQQNQKALNQLISEIKLQAYLDHPNLIKLYDFFSDETNVYLLLELASDGHLYDLLAKKKTFSEESTSIVVRQITQGIEYMHKHEIIHRDIKLENIVLCHGLAKICDFGWSVHCPKEFRSTICGTPLYLSPEILMGLQYNKKIDSWAIGALTHQLLTGDNPFKITKKEELSKIVTQDFQMERGSPELRSFITFILRKNPSKRPDTGTILKHPFIQKYKDLQTSDELCPEVPRRPAKLAKFQ